MKRSTFREEQIIGILKEHQAWLSAAALCRKHSVSEPTFDKWRSKYAVMVIAARDGPDFAPRHSSSPSDTASMEA